MRVLQHLHAGSTGNLSIVLPQCFCGLVTDDPSKLGVGTCDQECTGDYTEIRGDHNATSVYEPSATVPPGPTYVGCYADSKNDRIMLYEESSSTMTNKVR